MFSKKASNDRKSRMKSYSCYHHVYYDSPLSLVVGESENGADIPYANHEFLGKAGDEEKSSLENFISSRFPAGVS